LSEVIRLEKVSKTFETKQGIVNAVGPIDLVINKSEFVSLLGPSGCGKSTLLLIIAGLIKPTEGNVIVWDNLINKPQHNIGIVFQNPVLVDWRDVLGNVLLQIEMRKLDIVQYEKKAIKLLSSVGLGQFLHQHPYELSGGMQQRTAFCRALIHDPPLVLMDEPLGALDAMTREQLRRDLEKLWLATRKTLLFVTHDITEAIQLSDRIVVMSPRPGKIALDLTIKLPRPRTNEVLESSNFIQYEKEIKEIFFDYGVI